MKTIKKAGITYSLPDVYFINESGLGVSEYAARTCYESFDTSENLCIKKFHDTKEVKYLEDFRKINKSELLDKLAWVFHHESILEHTYLSYAVEGASRGVLQEHARHRMQNLSVKSTRYAMKEIIYMFLLSIIKFSSVKHSKILFKTFIRSLDMFVVVDDYVNVEIDSMFDKLKHQVDLIGLNEFIDLALSKDNKEILKEVYHSNNIYEFVDLKEVYLKMLKNKAKRNVGDNFKHIVTDNWKTNFVVTINIRSLKNYLNLRDSGAAYFLMRELAKELKKNTPIKYLRLLDKEFKDYEIPYEDNYLLEEDHY